MDRQVADSLVEEVAVAVEVGPVRGYLQDVGLLLTKRSEGYDRGDKVRKISEVR